MPMHSHSGHDHHHGHAHSHDVADIMRAAEALCQKNGTRLTEQRRTVLEVLAQSPKPMGAYDLIEGMRERTGRGPAPIAIYRSLDFLQDQGLIHRLETLNAFIACPHHHTESDPVIFLICEECRGVEEAVAEPLNAALRAVSASHEFVARRQVVELAGCCRQCRDTGGRSAA